MRRVYLALTPLLLALAFVIFFGVRAPSGEAACIPGGRPDINGNYHNGWFRDASLVTDNEAYIYNYDPYVFPGGGSTVAWVMLSRPNNPLTTADDEWAQVGWRKRPNLTRNTFIQYTYYESGTGQKKLITLAFAPANVGQYAQYEILYNTSSGYFEFWFQSQKLHQTPASFSPTSAETFAEVLNQKSQMPGGYSGGSYYEWFLYNYYLVYGGSWQPLNGTQVTYFPSWWNFDWDAGYPHQTMWVSDKACST